MLKTVFAALLLTTAACATDEEDVDLEEAVPTQDEEVQQDRGSTAAVPNPPEIKKLTRVPGNTNDNVQEVGPVGTTTTGAPESPNDNDVDLEPTNTR